MVTPGKVHKLIAATGLKAIEKLAEKHGVKLDLGDVKPVSEYVGTPGDGEDLPDPMEIAPRIVAHAMNRIPGLKKVGKMGENKGTRSGLLTDVFDFIAQILERNEDLIIDEVFQVVQGEKVKKTSSQLQPTQPQMHDVVSVEGVQLVQPEE